MPVFPELSLQLLSKFTEKTFESLQLQPLFFSPSRSQPLGIPDLNIVRSFPLPLQPYTIQVEVDLVGTPSHFATAFTNDAKRILLKVTDASGKESAGVWRQACDLLRQLKVKKGTLLQMTGITRT